MDLKVAGSSPVHHPKFVSLGFLHQTTLTPRPGSNLWYNYIMTNGQFDKWLMGLKEAWVTKNPQSAIDLCADNVVWYEIPFGKPLRTKQEILTEWQSVPTSQKDITVSYEILTVTESFGIAHWNARFTRLPSGVQAHLDGIYKVSLNDENLCTEFHQWYNAEQEDV